VYSSTREVPGRRGGGRHRPGPARWPPAAALCALAAGALRCGRWLAGWLSGCGEQASAGRINLLKKASRWRAVT
jgi:hypothetical protein